MKLEVIKEIEFDIDLEKKLDRIQLMEELGKYMKNILYIKKNQESIDELYFYLKTIKNESDLRYAESFIVGYTAITEFAFNLFQPIFDFLTQKSKSLQGETLDENKENKI